MAVLIRFESPKFLPGFAPTEEHIIDKVFTDSPETVTVHIWPLAGATSITAAVMINGHSKSSTLTPIVGSNGGQALTFTLGGDGDEFAGNINDLQIIVSDDSGTDTSALCHYYRRPDPTTTTTTTTTGSARAKLARAGRPGSHKKRANK